MASTQIQKQSNVPSGSDLSNSNQNQTPQHSSNVIINENQNDDPNDNQNDDSNPPQNILNNNNDINVVINNNIPKSNRIINNNDPSSNTAKTNDVFLSLKNRANKIAKNSTRKLRGLSVKKTKLTKSKSSGSSNGSSNEESDENTNNNTNNKKKRISSKIKLFNRQKSRSSPSTPNASDNERDNENNMKKDDDIKENDDNKPNANMNPTLTEPKRASIVIGATYSHSDNEMIEKSMRRKKKKFSLNRSKDGNAKRKNSKNGLFTRNKQILTKQQKNGDNKDEEVVNNNNDSNDNDDDEKKLEESANNNDKNNDNDATNNVKDNDDDKKENDDNSISSMISFQFLKNIDTTQMKSSMNTIISQSSQFLQKQREKVANVSTSIRSNQVTNNKSTSYLKVIPQKCLELWKKSMEYELNRFAKMSAQATYKPFNVIEKKDYFDNSESILWEDRIMTDIIRAGKLFVCGEVDEIFEFPSFKSTLEKQELVRTTIHYLESAVQETITSLLTINGVNSKIEDKKLNKDAAKEISIKSVRQSLISLCQEFVNDPYFKYLKQSCEKYNLQPTDIGLIGNQDPKSIKSWTPRLCINITGNRIYTHIVRVFQCYHVAGIEAIETQIYFGFKRTYSIDCLGGPPIILPPIFLSHDKEKQIAYQISIPKEKILDPIYANLDIPKPTDFIPTVD